MWTQEPDEHPSALLGKALKPQRPLLNYRSLVEGSPWLPEASSGKEAVQHHHTVPELPDGPAPFSPRPHSSTEAMPS